MSYQMGCCSLHSLQVQRDRQTVPVFSLKNTGLRAVPDPVFIGFGGGVQPGMKPGRRLLTG